MAADRGSENVADAGGSIRSDPGRQYLWWGAASHGVIQGFALIALLYWVVEAELEPLQLVLLGTALELSVFFGEVPTGIVADTLSRKWSLVIAHAVMAVGMILTGLTTAFIPLALAQMVWGIGWTFQSGADVAWVTDELNDPSRIDRVLTSKARWSLWGGIVGSVGFGLLAWAASLPVALVVAGTANAALGLVVAVTFRERNFERSSGSQLAESARIFKAGVALSRRDSQILLILLAMVIFNSGAEAVDRLFTLRLVDLGFPQDPEPIVWFTALSVITSLVGIVVLRYVEARISGVDAPRRLAAAAALVATVAALLLAAAPEIVTGLIAVLIARGMGMRVLPVVAAIWVNQRANSDVRATLQSFLGQAEAMGEIGGGIALGLVAQQQGVPTALIGSAALFAATALLVFRARPT